MKKQLLGVGLAATLALASSSSFATGKHFPPGHSIKDKLCHFLPFLCTKPEKPGKPDKPSQPETPHAVPEIDAANAGLALALISGLIAIRRERRNRR
jgi:hypothetical protein